MLASHGFECSAITFTGEVGAGQLEHAVAFQGEQPKCLPIWSQESDLVEEHTLWKINMDVSENSGTPKSSILIGIIGFSIINHPFWGTPILGNPHIEPENDGLEDDFPFQLGDF